MSGIKNLTSAGKTDTTISTPMPNIKNATTAYKECPPPNDTPQLLDFRISINWNSTYQFQQSDILNNYFDPSSPLSLKIVEVPTKGSLKLNGTSVVNDQTIYFSEIATLTYTPATNGSGLFYSSIKVRVNDQGIAPNPFSEASLIIFDVIANTGPSVEGKDICLVNDQTYVFSQQDFVAGYQDNQNDPPYQVKIESLPNSGSLTFNSTSVNTGDIFFVGEAELLRYKAPSDSFGDPYSSFDFSVNDEASLIFSDPQTINIDVNARPIISGKVISVDQDQSFIFSPEVLSQMVTDIDGDLVGEVQILSLPDKGILSYKGDPVSVSQRIEAGTLDIFSLAYTPIPGEFAYQYTSFQIRVKDSSAACPAWSDAALIRVDVKEIVNLPPQASSLLSISMCNLDTYTLKWNQFSNEFTDPEGEPLQKVRIDQLPNSGSLTLNSIAIIEGEEFFENQINSIIYESTVIAETVTFMWSGQDSDGQWSNSAQASIVIDQCTNPAPDFKRISVAVGGCNARVSSTDFVNAFISEQSFIEFETIIYTDQLLTQRFPGANQAHRIKNEAGLLIQKSFAINNQGEIVLIGDCLLIVATETVRVALGNCSDTISTLPTQTEVFYPSVNTLSTGTVLYTDNTLDSPFNGGGNVYRIEDANSFLIEKEFTIASNGEITSIDTCAVDTTFDGVMRVNDCSTSTGQVTLVGGTGNQVGDTIFRDGDLFLGGNYWYRLILGAPEGYFEFGGAVAAIISSFIVKISNNGAIIERQSCSNEQF